MPSSFARSIGMHAHSRARSRALGWRARAGMLSTLLLAAVTLATAPVRADNMLDGRVTATTDHGFTRLVFKFDQPVPARVSLTWPIMIIHFSKPVDVPVDHLNESAPTYISAARRDPDGSAVRIALARKVKYHVIPAGEWLFIDLLPENWSGMLPGLPQDVIDKLAKRADEADELLAKARLAARKALAKPVRVKVATLPTFTRYVFDLPIATQVDPERGDGTYTLHFDQPIKWDLADALVALPPTVQSIDAVRRDQSVAVHFKLNHDPQVRTFRDGHSYAIDIGSGGARPQRALAAGAARLVATEPGAPAIAPPETVPAQAAQAVQAAQATRPEAMVYAPSKDGAPPMVDMPAPDAPPGTKPAATPTPQIMVPKLARMAAKPPLATVKTVRQEPEMAKAMPKPAMPKPAIPKPAKAKPEMAKPTAAEAAAASAKPPPDAHKAKLKPIAPPPKTARHATAPPQMAQHVPAPVKRTTTAARTPAPNPNVPVVAGLHRDGERLQIEFPFAVSTPAAVFRRDDMLWLVFDNPAKIDLGKLVAESGGAIRGATVKRSKDGAAVVRIRLSRPRLISVDGDGPAWMVTIADTVTTATKPLGTARRMVGRDRANLIVPFEHPGKLHRLRDPEVGDHLLVMTGLAPVRGFLRPQHFVELDVLASRQGVVVRPIADDVTGKVGPDGVTFSRPGGLALSAAMDAQEQSAASFRATAFDDQLWSLDRSGDYYRRESKLIRMAAAAPPRKRKVARLNLARFYLARHMSAEALGVLQVAYHGEPDVTGSVLKSVANIMLHRPKDALKDLSQPQVGNQLDAPIWRAVAYVQHGEWASAHKLFRNVETAVAALPLELQRMAILAALRAAVEVRDFSQAERLVHALDGIGVTPKMKPEFEVLVGRLDEGLGRNDDALAKYQAAAAAHAGPATAQGKLREIELRYRLGRRSAKETIAALEMLTTIWRGDATEAEGLRLLAHLYTKEAHYRQAFHVMRVAMLAHPDSDLTRKIRDEAAATFESLFLSHKGDSLSPIKALGLFYDYRELTPIGRRGDEMIRRLADRLVAVDLLGQAAKLLKHQVDYRLQGAARAQVATRLAVIYLMDHKPGRALATLRSTRMAQLNGDLRDERLLLQARALSDLGRYDLALQIIQDIKGPQAMRLRADILWAGHRWRKAAEQIERLYGDRWKDFRPLSARARFDILRAAIGYALAGESLSLQRLRHRYAAKMESGPDGHAFDVVSAPIGTNNADFQAVASHIASLDTLDAFLRDMRKRYPDSSPISAQTEADNAAAPKPSLPDTVPPRNSNAGRREAKGSPNSASKPNAPDRSAANAPIVPIGASPPNVPQGVPLVPDQPTGSIGRR